MHLRPVERARRDDRISLAPERKHVTCETEPELRGDGAGEAGAVDGESEQDHVGSALLDHALQSGREDVILELVRFAAHVHDLVRVADG